MVAQDPTGVRGRVSVIVNCLNGEPYLREAIDSVYVQDYADWEIVFWDNCSTDGTAEIAQGYDERLRYFRGEETKPLGAARNRAMHEASGEFLAFLDCDDIWLATKLSAQVPLFDDNRVGLVYSDVIYFNDRGFARPKYGNRTPPEGDVFERFLFNNFTCMSTAVVRSAAIKKDEVWFDPAFSAVEDTDLFTRIARNWHFAYVPEVLCRYRMHANSISSSQPMLFREEEELMLRKYVESMPGFGARYQQRCQDMIDRDTAMVEWRQGKRRIARRRLQRLVAQDLSCAVLYLAAFFPASFVDRIRCLVTRNAMNS